MQNGLNRLASRKSRKADSFQEVRYADTLLSAIPFKHIQNIGTGCSVTRRYKVEGGIESLLDDLDIDTLFEYIEGNPPDVFENPLAIRSPPD